MGKIAISAGGTAEIKVRASADPLVLQYAPIRAVPFDVDVSEQSTAWTNRRLLVNWPLVIPTTGEQRAAEIMDVGVMIRGSSDPDDPRFDSRASQPRAPASGGVIRAGHRSLAASPGLPWVAALIGKARMPAFRSTNKKPAEYFPAGRLTANLCSLR